MLICSIPEMKSKRNIYISTLLNKQLTFFIPCSYWEILEKVSSKLMQLGNFAWLAEESIFLFNISVSQYCLYMLGVL